jgi:SGNH domain-containing protein
MTIEAVVALALALAPAGAAQLETSTALQRSAETVAPRPAAADRDRSQAYADGCLIGFRATRSPDCVYGHPRSSRTVVLFGDSHALQYFPAVERIALERGWRLVHLSKAGCPPAAARLRHSPSRARHYRACTTWRENALRRIQRERPFLVITAGSTNRRVDEGGRHLGRHASDRALGRGYAKTLRRLAAIAPRVVALRDSPRPPFDVAGCVAAHMRDLRRCAFVRPAARTRPDAISRAMARVRGVTLVDPLPELCPRRLCPAVIGDVLVWRRGAHLTATYTATMWRWLERELP